MYLPHQLYSVQKKCTVANTEWCVPVYSVQSTQVVSCGSFFFVVVVVVGQLVSHLLLRLVLLTNLSFRAYDGPHCISLELQIQYHSLNKINFFILSPWDFLGVYFIRRERV